MSDDNDNPFASYDYKETEEYKTHKRAMRKFSELSHEEKFQELIDIGIFNEDGELTEKYGGDAPNPDD